MMTPCLASSNATNVLFINFINKFPDLSFFPSTWRFFFNFFSVWVTFVSLTGTMVIPLILFGYINLVLTALCAHSFPAYTLAHLLNVGWTLTRNWRNGFSKFKFKFVELLFIIQQLEVISFYDTNFLTDSIFHFWFALFFIMPWLH